MKTTLARTEVEPFITVAEMKSYIGLEGDSKDAELTDAIESATTIAEDGSNIALRPMTMQLVGESDERYVKLYYPCVLSVDSVTDMDGNDVAFRFIAPLSSIKLKRDAVVIVTYKVGPQGNTTSEHKSRVLGNAALIFNGEF